MLGVGPIPDPPLGLMVALAQACTRAPYAPLRRDARDFAAVGAARQAADPSRVDARVHDFLCQAVSLVEGPPLPPPAATEESGSSSEEEEEERRPVLEDRERYMSRAFDRYAEENRGLESAARSGGASSFRGGGRGLGAGGSRSER